MTRLRSVRRSALFRSIIQVELHRCESRDVLPAAEREGEAICAQIYPLFSPCPLTLPSCSALRPVLVSTSLPTTRSFLPDPCTPPPFSGHVARPSSELMARQSPSPQPWDCPSLYRSLLTLTLRGANLLPGWNVSFIHCGATSCLAHRCWLASSSGALATP